MNGLNKPKSHSCYKTLYISEKLVSEIDKVAFENNTGFNHVVVSMIEQCLQSDDQKNK